MTTIARLEPFRGFSTLHDQVNRIFNETVRNHGDESALTAWAPSVDIYETPNELVVKADLPDVEEKDIDLRVERAYGTFSRSFSLPNTVNAEAIRAEYRNGVLTVNLPKREESKPRQVKVNVTSVSNGK